MSLSVALDQTDLQSDFLSSRQLLDFISSEGSKFETLTLGTSWSRNSLNRGLFPTAGTLNVISASVAIPGSSLTYGRLSHRFKYFRPLSNNFIFSIRTELGGLFAYGDTETAPPYENFYAGGLNSVRGFEQNSLGPRAVYDNFFSGYNRPVGGTYSLEGGFDLIFPIPFLEDTRSVRSSVFLDYGNVFSEECKSYETNCSEFDLSELRYSLGLGVTWITALGPMSFAISSVFGDDELDETETFQFEIGNQF